jgi:hypothetical protein
MAWQSDKGDSPIEGVVYPIIVHIPFYKYENSHVIILSVFAKTIF